MKPPKEPKTFNHPRLYWRELNPQKNDLANLIIIYPDGKTERTKVSFWDYDQFTNEPLSCCWDTDQGTPKQKVKQMKSWGNAFGAKTVFLGEIK